MKEVEGNGQSSAADDQLKQRVRDFIGVFLPDKMLDVLVDEYKKVALKHDAYHELLDDSDETLNAMSVRIEGVGQIYQFVRSTSEVNGTIILNHYNTLLREYAELLLYRGELSEQISLTDSLLLPIEQHHQE